MKRSHLITLIGAFVGACAGWLYWRYVGCASGSCSITSHPVNSTLYGMLMGGLLVNSLAPSTPKKEPSSTD